jgi:molecular chaperone GrpE
MNDKNKDRSFKIPVRDKRRGAAADAAAPQPAGEPEDHKGPGPVVMDKDKESVGQAEPVQPDYLEDLKRLQAEFDNYKKRMIREQTAMAERASANLIERLLPVLDNFESAIEHGEGGPGVEMVHRELRKILAEEGLEEIEAEGASFDPKVHEAFQAYDDPEASEPTVGRVLRRGYSYKGRVVRPSMVAVARPAEDESEEDSQDAAEG